MCVDSNALLGIAGQINPISTFGNSASTYSSTTASTHTGPVSTTSTFIDRIRTVTNVLGRNKRLEGKEHVTSPTGKPFISFKYSTKSVYT
jgi:hypothetical protein